MTPFTPPLYDHNSSNGILAELEPRRRAINARRMFVLMAVTWPMSAAPRPGPSWERIAHTYHVLHTTVMAACTRQTPRPTPPGGAATGKPQ